ncbi:hypothetical protein [Novosphingobium sp. UBA1939]|uniref:hypothetical protein n=1 Tax=Novosphingobium sp. UBA1939 TaxID=1946982 RepID=UPI0025E4577E|nr:hypothetical protein [Novosphingobium sp. UBA1939]
MQTAAAALLRPQRPDPPIRWRESPNKKTRAKPHGLTKKLKINNPGSTKIRGNQKTQE